jgi:hypothetical protein
LGGTHYGGAVARANSYCRSRSHHDLHQVLLIQSGEVSAPVDDVRTRLGAPAIIMTLPGILPSFCFQPGTVGLVASFAPGLVPDLATAASGFSGFPQELAASSFDRPSLELTDLEAIGEMLLREFGRSAPGRRVALRGLLAALLAKVMRLMRVSKDIGRDLAVPQPELVARFRPTRRAA